MENPQAEIISVVDEIVTDVTKKHIWSAIPATAQPLLVTTSNPNNVTPLMTYIYEKYMRPITLDIEGKNLIKINGISHMHPIPDMDWNTKSSVIPDWGDLGLYMWSVIGGHAVLLINLHHVKYSRFAYTLKVLYAMTVDKTKSKVSQKYFSDNIHHIIIQHMECLPNDNATAFLNIIESLMMSSNASMSSNRFRLYIYSSNKINWNPSTWQKLKGICRHIPVNLNVRHINTSSSKNICDVWKSVWKYTGGDIVKTIVITKLMPPILNGDDDKLEDELDDKINKHVYAYLTFKSAIFKCLDKFFMRTVFIRRLYLSPTSLKQIHIREQECIDILQTPMSLANNLIGSGYMVSYIISTCNRVAAHINKYGGCIYECSISNNELAKVIEYGNSMLREGLDIDKPVMALAVYFQKIINLFSPLD